MKHLQARLAAAAPWLAGALVAGEVGWLRMVQPVLCGLHQGPGHCGACYAAAALFLVGLSMALRTPPAQLCVAKSPSRR